MPETSDRDLSIVVQGPFYPEATMAALRRLRALFPAAEMILATWDTPALPAGLVDKVLALADPGAPLLLRSAGAAGSKDNNVNRQLVSTQAGLAVATRRYALKIRSDMALDSRALLQRQRPPCSAGQNYFMERITVNLSGCMDPRIGPAAHPGDFLFFGLRQDLNRLFQIPLYQPLPLERADWLGSRLATAWGEDFAKRFAGHLCPEMSVWAPVMASAGKAPAHFFDDSPDSVKTTEATFAAYLDPVEDHVLGLVGGKAADYPKETLWRNLKGYAGPRRSWHPIEQFAIWLTLKTRQAYLAQGKLRWIWGTWSLAHGSVLLSLPIRGSNRALAHGLHAIGRLCRMKAAQ